jgi:hypothetical protein
VPLVVLAPGIELASEPSRAATLTALDKAIINADDVESHLQTLAAPASASAADEAVHALFDLYSPTLEPLMIARLQTAWNVRFGNI